MVRSSGSGSQNRGLIHRLHSSSFLGLPYRSLNINHKKELLRSLWILISVDHYVLEPCCQPHRQSDRVVSPRGSGFLWSSRLGRCDSETSNGTPSYRISMAQADE